MGARAVPSDVWEMQVIVGDDENGERVYGTITGKSKEEVEQKAKQMARKRKLQQQNEWQKENLERLSVVLKKGTKDRIRSLDIAVNKFVAEAVEKELQNRGV